MANPVVQFHYHAVQSTKSAEPCCEICHDPLYSLDLGHVVNEATHLFHESCLFQWFDRSATCPICRSEALLPKIKIPLYHLLPVASIDYSNNESNLELVAETISSLYAFFLTREAHEGETCTALRTLSINLAPFSKKEYASSEKINFFASNLRKEIQKTLLHQKYVELQIGYSPGCESPIRKALKQSEIAWKNFKDFFPYNTNCTIEIKKDRIRVVLLLHCPRPSFSAQKLEDFC